MNTNFDWNRFGRLVAKDFRNIWPLFGPTMLVITLLPLAIWLFVSLISNPTGIEELPVFARWCFLYGSVMLTAIMAPSRLYKTCNLHHKGIYFAMLPASKLEKFLSMLLMTLVVCPLMVFCGSIVLDYILYIIPFGPYNSHLFDSVGPVLAEASRAFGEVGMDTTLLVVTLLFSSIGTAANFFFTATIFKRHKVLYTILWLWLISFVLNIIITPLAFCGILPEWVVKPELFVNHVHNFMAISAAVNIAYAVGIYVWSALRLKRMTY